MQSNFLIKLKILAKSLKIIYYKDDICKNNIKVKKI